MDAHGSCFTDPVHWISDFNNSFFLKTYYVHKTKKLFIEEYQQAKAQVATGERNLQNFLGIRNAESGYKFYLIDRNYGIRYISTPEFAPNSQASLPKNQRDVIEAFKNRIDQGEILYTVVDRDGQGKAVVQLTALFDKDTYFVITQSMEQLEDSAAIANEFLMLAGLVFMGIAILVSYVAANRMVKPILEISEMTQGIARLDFSKRYSGQSQDEIGVLGQNINQISEKLDVTIENLQHSNEQLAKEMELQKRFIASVSHEFKTPVGLIRGYTESLKLGMAKTPEEASEISDIIIKEADRLNFLVKDIVMLMHMDSGSFQMRKEVFDFSETIHEVLKKFALSIESKEIRIRQSIPEMLEIVGDEMRLTQVIENLMSNAIRAIERGGLLTINACAVDGFVKVELINTGKPIDALHLVHLFEPFYRASADRSRKSGGTGLGLSIVKGIIENHGGQCGIENCSDGIKAWFTVPLSMV